MEQNNSEDLPPQGGSDTPVAGAHGGLVPAAGTSLSCEGPAGMLGASTPTDTAIAAYSMMEVVKEVSDRSSEVNKEGRGKRGRWSGPTFPLDTEKDSDVSGNKPPKQKAKICKQTAKRTMITCRSAQLGHSELSMQTENVTNSSMATEDKSAEEDVSPDKETDREARRAKGIPPNTDRYFDIAIAQSRRKRPKGNRREILACLKQRDEP